MITLKMDTPDDDLFFMALRVLKTEGMKPKAHDQKTYTFQFLNQSIADLAKKILNHYGVKTSIEENAK